jgi:TRAP-type C4-dicarboxylate transport system substrate-binding protein
LKREKKWTRGCKNPTFQTRQRGFLLNKRYVGRRLRTLRIKEGVMEKKKWIARGLSVDLIAVLVILTFVVVGVESASAQKRESPVVLKVSHDLPGTSKGTKVVMANMFKELVESRSQGGIVVQIHPGGELYNDPDGLVATSKGTIFSQVVSSDALTTWEPGIEIFSMYGLFDGRDHCTRFLADKNGGQELYGRLEKKRLFVRLYVSGPWLLWTKTQVNSLEDLKGMPIRTSLSKMEASCIQALGCTTFPLAVGELFTAAQTGMIKGTVTLPLSVASRKLEEVFHFCVIEPPFEINYAGMAVSKVVLDKLSPDLRKIVTTSLDEAADFTSTQGVKVNDDYVKELRGKGVTFVKLSPPEWAKFRTKFSEVHKKFVAENPKALEGLMKGVEATR